MELSQVKKDLKEIKAFYANEDAVGNFSAQTRLVEKYKTAISTASSQLIAFFVYYYMQNNNIQVVAENMQLSESSIFRLSRELKEYFCAHL